MLSPRHSRSQGPVPHQRHPWRSGAVHCLRVVLLAVLLLLIHQRHQRLVASQRARGLDDVPLSLIQELFPEATGLGDADARGGRTVLAGESPVGAVLQTFPEAEAFFGFSGPTNVLIGADNDGKVVGTAIVGSRDTRDHVELIRRNQNFLHALDGLNLEEAGAEDVDSVSGATLTSLAIVQGIRARLGKQAGSLKFPDSPTLELVRKVFPEAAEFKPSSTVPEVWDVFDQAGAPVGKLLCNSPVADELIGYQGPTRAFLGFTSEGKILEMVLGTSYDNEPYVGYVRENDWFRGSLRDRSLDELARMKWEEAGIEGVSGATMTSQAVAQGLLMAAARRAELLQQKRSQKSQTAKTDWRIAGTILIVSLALLLGFSRLRGKLWLRVPLQLLLIGYLGLINGDLLSTAMFVGWAQNGIPLKNALGLLVLSAAALILPVLTRQNVYCDHICPHGAVQQLLPRRWKLRKTPASLVRVLKWVRPLLLVLAILVAFHRLDWNLVNLEPFDAYAWRAAAWPTMTLAVGSLCFSLLVPMGYCHYGCPLGATLGYLRRHARSDRLTRADALAVILLLLAVVLR